MNKLHFDGFISAHVLNLSSHEFVPSPAHIFKSSVGIYLSHLSLFISEHPPDTSSHLLPSLFALHIYPGLVLPSIQYSSV